MKRKALCGITIIDVVFGLLVVFCIMSVILIGAGIRGTDRKHCISNMHSVQLAVRAETATRGLGVGEPINTDFVFGEGKIIQECPTCPSGGSYSFLGRVPKRGEVYMFCNHKGHVPTDTSNW
jgi:hypothetical protein